MESSASLWTLLEVPFPGLRAFETEEAILFFGRETHTRALLRRLSESRFLAVVGSSGCGKSSFVRAGLLPALFRGYLESTTSHWRYAVLRPGTKPVDALAAALAKPEALGPAQDEGTLRKMLGATSGGLVEAVRTAGLAPGESLLVVVDQFEELFRFVHEGGHGDAEGQAALFVGLLLRAVESDMPVYVTLTMRSDYQGDCAQFPGLPEALNRSQYLVPRLTREQRQEAIVRPLELVGAMATPRLINRLLNDAGDDPDQLPVLQHALLQTYRHWKGKADGPIDLADYDAVGGIANALGKHGDGILAGLAEDDRRLTEKIFRSLTTSERGRMVRRPKELGAIYAVVNAVDEPARQRVRDIISAFARREHSLLMLSSPELAPGTMVDITHESLIRKWPALRKWVQEESRSTDWYGDLARDVLRYRTEDAGLWRDPELSRVIRRRDREGWNTAWALQGSRPDDPPFAEVERFLSASSAAQAKALRRGSLRRWLTSILLLLVLLTVLIAGAVISYNNQRNDLKVKRVTAKYLSIQAAYSAAKRKASEDLAKYEATNRQLDQLKAADPVEKARLRQELETLRRSYTDSQNAANTYQNQITDLRKNQDLTASDHNALLNRIQELQKNLNAITNERDKLRSEASASAPKPADPALVRRNEELQTQITAMTAELNRLRASPAAQRPTAVRPTFIVLSQYSVLYLPAPFVGNVALGVGNVPDELAQRVGIYIWTNDGKTPLPEAFSGDEKRARKALGRLDKPGCSGGGTEARSCFEVRRIDAILGHQQVGRFTLGGLSYEARATGWSSHVSGYKDSISLAIYPVSQAAR
jgi:hypothetical protein